MPLPGEGADGEIMLDKGRRGGGTGGGTIGPGAGFGGAFGGGGSGFLGSERGVPSLTAFGGLMMPQKRRQLMGANGPVPISYSPMKADTVPAMLSPGEFVVNNRSMQIPGVPEMLQQVNAMGNGGMPGGPQLNTHPTMQMFADGGPVIDPELLQQVMEILKQMGLLDGGDMGGDMGDMGGGMVGTGEVTGQVPGEVQHFAWGGQVRPQQGGFGAPRMPAQGFGGGGMGSMSSPRPQGLSTAPTMQPYGGGVRTPPPAPVQTAPTPNATTAETYNTGIADLNNLLRQYTDAGYFSPGGNPAIMKMVQDTATSNADAMRQRQANALNLGGMDAGQAASMKLMGDLRGQGDVANALNGAYNGALQQQQGFANNLFNTMGQFNLNDWNSYLDFVRASRLKG